MHIAIDIDGTINEATPKWEFPMAERWMAANGIEFGKPNYAYRNIKDAYGVSDKVFRAWMDEFFPLCVKDAPPRIGAPEAIRTLKQMGHQISIVTRRDPNYNGKYKGEELKNDTIHWFKKNNIPYNDIYFGCKDKASVCNEISADIMIEDEILNIEPLAKAGVPCIIVRTPYNDKKEYHNIPNLVYKDTWPDILKFLLNLSQSISN